MDDRAAARLFDRPGHGLAQRPVDLERSPPSRVALHEVDHAGRHVLSVHHVQEASRDPGIGEDGLPRPDLLTVGEHDSVRPPIVNTDPTNGRSEANIATRGPQTAHHRVRDRLGATLRDRVAPGRRCHPEHEAERSPEEVVGPDVDVQRQTR